MKSFGYPSHDRTIRNIFTLIAAHDLQLLDSLDDKTEKNIIDFYKTCFDYDKVFGGDCEIYHIVLFARIVLGEDVTLFIYS